MVWIINYLHSTIENNFRLRSSSIHFWFFVLPQVFPWGDMDMGEQITCTGRQYLRQMIMWFMKRGYQPLVMDTDGVNFSVPEGRNDHKYIGLGLNGLLKKVRSIVVRTQRRIQ